MHNEFSGTDFHSAATKGGDVIDRGRKLGVLKPDAVDLAGCDRDVGLLFDLLDELDELIDHHEGAGDADTDAPLVEAQPGRVEDPLEDSQGRDGDDGEQRDA